MSQFYELNFSDIVYERAPFGRVVDQSGIWMSKSTAAVQPTVRVRGHAYNIRVHTCNQCLTC